MFPGLFDATHERRPFGLGKRLVRFRLPVLGKTRRPVTETSAQAIIKQLAPTSGIAVAFADAREAVQLAGLDHIGRFQAGGPDRVPELGECIIHRAVLPGG